MTNRYTLTAALLALIALLIAASTPAHAAPIAHPDGYTWLEAFRILWAVAQHGWAGLPDSPFIGCTAPAPAPLECWLDLHGGGQLWIRG